MFSTFASPTPSRAPDRAAPLALVFSNARRHSQSLTAMYKVSKCPGTHTDAGLDVDADPASRRAVVSVFMDRTVSQAVAGEEKGNGEPCDDVGVAGTLLVLRRSGC